MANITLKGPVNVMGNITFKGDKLIVGSAEALVQVTGGDVPQGAAPPVMLPPPPAGPAFPQPDVWIVVSFNPTVKQKTKAIVALGMAMQGVAGSPWPGMVLPSSVNAGGPTINHIPINVVGDKAVIFPSGGSASFTSSGQ